MEKAWDTIRRIRLREREQTPGEEIANSVSHAVGAILALIAAVVLVTKAAERGAPGALVGAAVFAGTMVFAYVSSAIYHALRHPPAKRLFKVVDHSAILLLIAGTYTPFTLGVYARHDGPVAARPGVGGGRRRRDLHRGEPRPLPDDLHAALRRDGLDHPHRRRALWRNMSHWGLFWLGAGGLAYTGGIVFFAVDRVRFGHLVWHLCVLAARPAITWRCTATPELCLEFCVWPGACLSPWHEPRSRVLGAPVLSEPQVPLPSWRHHVMAVQEDRLLHPKDAALPDPASKV
jgi:hemolysin III